MSEDRPPAGAPKLTLEEQAEAYKRGTPAFRRATRIMFVVVVIGTILLIAFAFHTAHG